MKKVAGEDSGRRALAALPEEESGGWLKTHRKASYEPLLVEPWAWDVDTTGKLLDGRREAAKVGGNPPKPGRPTHSYHRYFIAHRRLVREVEGQAGNQTAASFAQPELWALLDGLPKWSQPQFLRGDCNGGTDRAMAGCEQRQPP